VPIAAEQTASGYEIALKDAADNLYSIWNTDSTGNFLSFALYSGNSTALEALEPSFHQDLNGDGVIGVPTSSVLFANEQAFVFRSDLGSHAILDRSVETAELVGFEPNPGHDLEGGQLAPILKILPIEEMVPAANLADHHDLGWISAHAVDLHGQGFLIR
jgi:hypothetical protein